MRRMKQTNKKKSGYVATWTNAVGGLDNIFLHVLSTSADFPMAFFYTFSLFTFSEEKKYILNHRLFAHSILSHADINMTFAIISFVCRMTFIRFSAFFCTFAARLHFYFTYYVGLFFNKHVDTWTRISISTNAHKLLNILKEIEFYSMLSFVHVKGIILS